MINYPHGVVQHPLDDLMFHFFPSTSLQGHPNIPKHIQSFGVLNIRHSIQRPNNNGEYNGNNYGKYDDERELRLI